MDGHFIFSKKKIYKNQKEIREREREREREDDDLMKKIIGGEVI